MSNSTKYTILFIFLLSGKSQAQELIVNWTKFVSCANSATIGTGGIAIDDGGFLFISYTGCQNSGDYPLATYGGQDLVVGKVDANEQIVWIKNYGGSGDDWAEAICRSHDGGYVILTRTFSNDGDITGYKGAGDLWLLKIDANGNKIWSKTYGSASDEQAVDLALTHDNGFIVLGASNGFGDDVPSHYGSSPFLLDWFVLKVDEHGDKQWAKSMGGSLDEFSSGAILSIDTSYYLISNSESKDHECTDNNWNPGVATKTDGYIIKLDNSGNVLWNKVYGGTSGDVYHSAFYDDRDNTIMISGSSGSNDHYLSGNHGGNDFWLLKTGLDGKIIWNKLVGAKNDEQWSTIIKGPQNGYMLYGYTNGGKYSGVDSWLFALDKNGNVLKDKFVGGNRNESSYFIFPYQQGYMTIGYSMSDSFAEGKNNTRFGTGQQLHLTKIEYFPLTVNDDEKTQELQVFPNPADGKFTITLPRKKKGILKIWNAGGQLVHISAISKRTNSIPVDAADWPSGVYAILLQTEEGQTYKATLSKQ